MFADSAGDGADVVAGAEGAADPFNVRAWRLSLDIKVRDCWVIDFEPAADDEGIWYDNGRCSDSFVLAWIQVF